ncbi:MAG TPA: DUF3500 domain-containing protein [Thermoanaerobaculia bacterium]|jgi:hypothetical protein|nr:DUF3500 domain-containing protein [Thermoanaerobaculia bacterium]
MPNQPFRVSIAGIFAVALLLCTTTITAQTSNCTAGSSVPTKAVCSAAESFFATLSATQKNGVQFAFDRATASSKWSNLPCGAACRNGLRFSTLSATQLEAALAVAQAALSTAGYGTFHGIRMADDVLGALGPISTYNSGIYFIAFIGTPSSTGEWILQLGGHHYALNFYYHGTVESPTPYYTGINPHSFTLNGQSYAPLKPKTDAMVAMMAGLDTTQRTAAKLSGTFGDVLLGPGADDSFPPPSGLKVSTLSATQQALVVDAMEAWVNDMPSGVASDFLAAYTSSSALENTYIGWAGVNPNLASQGSYIRIDGPRAWMEIVVQGPAATPGQLHYHAIWRDETLDYGGDGTLVLDPGTITFAEPSYFVVESAGVVTIDIQRNGGTTGAVSVAYAVAGGTATAGSDLESVSGVLTWADGESGSKSFQMPILNDQMDESDETVVFTLSSAAGGAALGSPASTMLTIRDDDGTLYRRRAVRH